MTKNGIDVASWQPNVDWPRVKAAGIDFAMTSLFTVIFVEQWQASKSHVPAFLGLGAAALSLALLGPQNFILPAMLAICVMLVALRRQLAKEAA